MVAALSPITRPPASDSPTGSTNRLRYRDASPDGRPTAWQPSLFESGEPGFVGLDGLERIQLDDSSWLDIGRGVLSGADRMFDLVRAGLSWSGSRRTMYDRIVDVPRLSATVPVDDPSLPDPVTTCAHALGSRYQRRFDLIVANLYRDGDDAVAWHGDRIGRRVQDPIIAIVSLGDARRFRIRPRDKHRPALDVVVGGGDLLVMGGSCQHRWEHAVPRVRHAGPRIGVTFRHDHDAIDRPPSIVGGHTPHAPGPDAGPRDGKGRARAARPMGTDGDAPMQ